MPVKGTKALETVKGTTVVTSYTTGSPVVPAAGHLAVYVDLPAADQHRQLELINKLQTLVDRAREIDYHKPTAAALYLRVPIDGDKESIEVTALNTAIVEGDVAIGISASVRSGSHGNVLFTECWRQIIDHMREQYFLPD